jgi:hypothetical protein
MNHKSFQDTIVGWSGAVAIATGIIQSGYNNLIQPIAKQLPQVQIDNKGDVKLKTETKNCIKLRGKTYCR